MSCRACCAPIILRNNVLILRCLRTPNPLGIGDRVNRIAQLFKSLERASWIYSTSNRFYRGFPCIEFARGAILNRKLDGKIRDELFFPADHSRSPGRDLVPQWYSALLQ